MSSTSTIDREAAKRADTAGYYDVTYTVRGSSYRFDEFNTVWGDTPDDAKRAAIAAAKEAHGEVSIYITNVEESKDVCD